MLGGGRGGRWGSQGEDVGLGGGVGGLVGGLVFLDTREVRSGGRDGGWMGRRGGGVWFSGLWISWWGGGLGVRVGRGGGWGDGGWGRVGGRRWSRGVLRGCVGPIFLLLRVEGGEWRLGRSRVNRSSRVGGCVAAQPGTTPRLQARGSELDETVPSSPLFSRGPNTACPALAAEVDRRA